MKNKYKIKGFTQLELLLVVGVILIMSMVIYSTYTKRQLATIADKQVTYLEFMVQGIANGLTGINSNDPSTFGSSIGKINTFTSTTNLVNNQLIPPEMINGDGTIRNLWGGTVTVTGTPLDVLDDGINNPQPAFKITLTGVPAFGCTVLTTNVDLTNTAQQITINGDANIVKFPNTPNVNVANAATLCNNDFNTVSFFKNAFKAGYVGVESSNAPAVLRYKENKYHIATPGTNSLGAGACFGSGATFDAAQSTCVCPAGEQWTGYRCVPENSGLPNEAGFCPLGQGWDFPSKQCIPLAAPTITSKIICPPGVTDTTDPRCITSDYTGNVSPSPIRPGRMVPQNILRDINASTAEVPPADPEDLGTLVADPASGFSGQVTLTSQIDGTWYRGVGYNAKSAIEQCQLLGNNDPARPMVVTPTNSFEGREPGVLPVARPTYYPSGTVSTNTGNWDNKVCNVCVYGTWDGDRCVTPPPPITN